MNSYKTFLKQLPTDLEWGIIPYHKLGNSKREALGQKAINIFSEPNLNEINEFKEILLKS
jgi:hypothetical protein